MRNYEFIVYFFVGILTGSAAVNAEPDVIKTAQVQSKKTPVYEWFVGAVESKNIPLLGAEIAGKIIWVAELGQVIKKGEAVAEIDCKLLSLNLAQGESEQQSVKSRLDYLTAHESAVSSLSRQNAISVNEGLKTQSDRKIAQYQLEEIKSQILLIKEKIARCKIISPVSGVVTERLHVGGEIVETGDAIARVVDHSNSELRFRVPYHYISAIEDYAARKQGLPVIRGNQQIDSDILTYYTSADANNRIVYVHMKNALKARLNQAVWLGMPSHREGNWFVVPIDAVMFEEGQKTAVFKIVDGKAHKIPVEVLEHFSEVAYVSGKLDGGDVVAIRGAESLRENAEVKVLK